MYWIERYIGRYVIKFLESLLYDAPQGNQTTRFVGGILAPLPFAIYGMLCIVNLAGAFPGDHYTFQFEGIDAAILGIMFLSVASYLHCHYFLGLSENLDTQDYAILGKQVSLCVLVVSFAWVTWCMLRGFVYL